MNAIDKADPNTKALVSYAQALEAQVDALKRPITMQDIRLMAGEGKLSAHTVLEAANAVLRSRQQYPEISY